MAGMYGYSDKDWEYIWKNADFWEVFIPSKGGYEKAYRRKRFWERMGFEVFPYEDEGVSVGIYVMTKDGVRTYGERSELIKLMEYEECVPDIKKQKLRFCECGAELAKRARYCKKCKKKKARESHRKYNLTR